MLLPPAETSLRRAAKEAERFGEKDARLAVTLDSLGLVLHNEARFAEAEPLFKQACAIAKEIEGPESPNAAINMSNLATVYRDLARYSEAEMLYRQSLAIVEKQFGKSDPHVAIALNNLAHLYKTQGRFSEAAPLYKRSLDIYAKAYGPEHPRRCARARSHTVLASPAPLATCHADARPSGSITCHGNSPSQHGCTSGFHGCGDRALCRYGGKVPFAAVNTIPPPAAR